MKISVVIPVKDDGPELHRCLMALAAQTRPADEIIVVDNGSTDDSALIARRSGARVIAERAAGIAAAASTGYDAADGDVILRLDADSRPPIGWIGKYERRFEDPSIAAVTGPGVARGLNPRATGVFGRLYMYSYFDLVGMALAKRPLFGSNMGIRREVWLEMSALVHRHDEEVHDDLDLTMHLRPEHRVVLDHGILVSISSRPLRSLPSMVQRVRRGIHTVRVHGGAHAIHRWRARFKRESAERAQGSRIDLHGLRTVAAIDAGNVAAVSILSRTLGIAAAVGYAPALVGVLLVHVSPGWRPVARVAVAGGAVVSAGLAMMAQPERSVSRWPRWYVAVGGLALGATYLVALGRGGSQRIN